MASVKKIRPISFKVIDKIKAIAALEIHAFTKRNGSAFGKHKHKKEARMMVSSSDNGQKQIERIEKFDKAYRHSYYDVIVEIWKWHPYILSEERSYSLEEIYSNYVSCISQVNKEPMKLKKYDGREYLNENEWVFKGYVYEVNGFYSDDEIKLLILEDFDKERGYFEKLNAKFNQTASTNTTYERLRIPESVRVEVWRRDSGKCARCGSREKLEYDHIVPISKGGNNTTRNIELLCEKCNRSKSNNVV